MTKSITLSGKTFACCTILHNGLEWGAVPSIENWKQMGVELIGLVNRAPWWIGDWLNFGERNYGEKYKDAVEATGLAYGTLANFKMTAKSIELSRRRENLSFAHHQEVAPVPKREQNRWLKKAEQEGWTKMELRAAIRADRLVAEVQGPPPENGEIGRGRDSFDNIKANGGGTDPLYLGRRLMRDKPDVWQEFKAGKFQSVHAAAKAAGIVPTVSALDKAKKAVARLSDDERREIFRQYPDQIIALASSLNGERRQGQEERNENL